MHYDDELNQLLGYMQDLKPDSTFYRPMRYILDHISSLAAMSIYDLADSCFVSTSTISRLCKELGFKNYQEFKIRTYACYRRLAESDDMLFPAYASTQQNTDDKMVAGALSYLDYCQKALSHFGEFAHSEQFIAHMKLLREAETIALYSMLEWDTLTLARRLILRGKAVRMYSGDVAARCAADQVDWAHTCTIALVYLDTEYQSLCPLLEKQQQQGAVSILICPDRIPVKRELHDQIFTFPAVEGQRDKLFYELYINCIMNAY